SIGSFSYSFLLLYAKEAGFQAAAVPLLYLIFTLVAALCSLPFGKLSDRIGRKPVLFFSFLSWGLTCAGFLYLETSAGIILSFIFFGLHKAALEPVQKTLVSELAPSEIRASALGGFQMIVGLCAFPSSLFAGLLWEHIQPEAPLYCSLFLTIITLGLLFLVKEKRKAVKISS
ncbi:MAG: MFS transporter, partial [Bacteroidetes bacterium]